MLFISSTKLKCVIIILVTVVNKKKNNSSLYLRILKSYAKSFSYCLLHSAVLTHLLNHLVTQMLAGEQDACDLDSVKQSSQRIHIHLCTQFLPQGSPWDSFKCKTPFHFLS